MNSKTNNNKNIKRAILLLLIMYGLAFAYYYGSDNSYIKNNASLLGLTAVLIISLIMMIVPLFAWLLKDKKLPSERGKKICKWNSIIFFIISILLFITGNYGFVGGIGAVIYYYINKWLFVNEFDYTKINSCKNDYQTNKISKKRKFKCSNCDYLVDEDAKKCPNCGLYFEDKK